MLSYFILFYSWIKWCIILSLKSVLYTFIIVLMITLLGWISQTFFPESKPIDDWLHASSYDLSSDYSPNNDKRKKTKSLSRIDINNDKSNINNNNNNEMYLDNVKPIDLSDDFIYHISDDSNESISNSIHLNDDYNSESISKSINNKNDYNIMDSNIDLFPHIKPIIKRWENKNTLKKRKNISNNNINSNIIKINKNISNISTRNNNIKLNINNKPTNFEEYLDYLRMKQNNMNKSQKMEIQMHINSINLMEYQRLILQNKLDSIHVI